MFQGLGFIFQELDRSDDAAPAETASSFRENSEVKARYWSRLAGGLAVASDGGMIIPALGDRWDALRTGRAAGLDADDTARACHLLSLTESLRDGEREVRWCEGLALAQDGRLVQSWEASGTHAVLVRSFQPSDLRAGFWAGSLCYVPRFQTTLANLTEEQLAQVDGSWSELRRQVRDYLGSGETNARATPVVDQE